MHSSRSRIRVQGAAQVQGATVSVDVQPSEAQIDERMFIFLRRIRGRQLQLGDFFAPFVQHRGAFLFSDLRRLGTSANTLGILFQKFVYSTFFMKIVLNCIHIWSVDLFLVEDEAPESFYLSAVTKSWHHVNWSYLELLTSGANHARLVGLFFEVRWTAPSLDQLEVQALQDIIC